MMKFIKKIKSAKNAKVNLVEIDGKLWVHKKEDVESSLNEKQFYKELKRNGLPALEVLEINLPDDEIVIEFIQDSPVVTESVEDYYAWGQVLRKLYNIKHDKPSRLTVSGFTEIDPVSTCNKELILAKERILTRDDFTASEADSVTSILTELLPKLDLEYSLIHGDMHSASVLKKDNKLFLFDKSSTQWGFTPLLDLAIVMIGIPNGYLAEVDDPEHANDDKLRESFIAGYGDIDLEDVKVFSRLEAARRINNSHEPFNPDIVRNLLEEWS